MFRKFAARVAALLAAAMTTLSVFSAVAGLADEDRALVLAARQPQLVVAAHSASVPR